MSTLVTSPSISWPDPARQQLFDAWLAALPTSFGLRADTLRPASADASFRRYFRIDAVGGSYIIMDAPPEKEDSAAFVRIAALLSAGGINAPQVLASDLAAGFLLLTDLGGTTYLQALQSQEGQDPKQAHALYMDALGTLTRLQAIAAPSLPHYDHARLIAEMRLFDEWYVAKHLGATLTPAEHSRLLATYELIAQTNLAEAQVLVHRDYHSRNLMQTSAGNPGVLDFQDAVIGPISYDLVSLLRDAYIEWTEAQQLDWAIRYWQLAKKANLPVPENIDDFYRNFEWMGLQRHLKVLGIFARLHHRDGKDGYLANLPLVAKYAASVCQRYTALAPLGVLLNKLHGVKLESGVSF